MELAQCALQCNSCICCGAVVVLQLRGACYIVIPCRRMEMWAVRGPAWDLALRTSACFAHQLALALQHAHAHGVVHNDVTPGNAVLGFCAATNTPQLKVQHRLMMLDTMQSAHGHARVQR